MVRRDDLYLQLLNQTLPAGLPLQILPALREQSSLLKPKAHNEAAEEDKKHIKENENEDKSNCSEVK